MRLFSLVLALVTLSGTAQAASDAIPYIPMNFCKHEYKDNRQMWDKTRSVCFEKDGQSYEFKLSKMGEIKLRDNGQWVKSAYLESGALSPQSLAEIGEYSKYYVRYMSYSAPVDGKIPFLAHVFFSYGRIFGRDLGTQTMYVFGEASADGVKVTGYSNSDAIDGDVREYANIAANALVIFQGLNPIRIGAEQTLAEDRARSAPVADVVGTYLRKAQDKPLDQRLD